MHDTTRIRLVAVKTKRAEGAEALTDYLRATMTTTVLGVALVEQGSAGACQLMAEGLEVAEHYDQDVA